MEKETTVIPSHIALAIVVMLASVAIVAILIGNYQLNQLNQASVVTPIPVKIADNCNIKAFAGQSEIHVWPSASEGKDVVAIRDEDITQLPPIIQNKQTKNLSVKIIDPTPELEASLASATKDNPVPVTIQGYLSRCENKVALASIQYRDKIFSDHLND